MAQVNVDWNKYAVQYDAITTSGINPAYVELVDKVNNYFSNIDIPDESLILDLGGGTGNFSIPLAKQYQNSSFVILDNSETMLEQAENKIKQHGLTNIETRLNDCEKLEQIADEYQRPINHTIMIHALYAMRTKDDPEKPKRVLDNLSNTMYEPDSTLFISDINRPLKTGSWIAYAVWNGLKTFKSINKTLKYFMEHDEAKRANRFIDQMQQEGHFLLCELDQLEEMVKEAGFSKIYEKSDQYYRGRDNLIIAGK